MTPAVIDAAGKGDIDEGAPFRTFGLPEQLHPCLMRQTVSFARVAGNTGADDVFPRGLSAAVAGENMIDVEIRSVEVNAAILTGVLVAFEDIVPRELDLFFWKPVEEAEHDDSRNPDPE